MKQKWKIQTSTKLRGALAALQNAMAVELVYLSTFIKSHYALIAVREKESAEQLRI
jgi:hypothetical protein